MFGPLDILEHLAEVTAPLTRRAHDIEKERFGLREYTPAPPQLCTAPGCGRAKRPGKGGQKYCAEHSPNLKRGPESDHICRWSGCSKPRKGHGVLYCTAHRTLAKRTKNNRAKAKWRAKQPAKPCITCGRPKPKRQGTRYCALCRP